MELSEMYPAFTLVDKWGRKIRYSRSGKDFYRRVINPPAAMPDQLNAKKISRHVYAAALLYFVEYIAGDAYGVYMDSTLIGPTGEGEDELDAHFGPKRTP